jgi:S-DNA-T family DNA segregation ATPase FtsK/SpoIIIE
MSGVALPRGISERPVTARESGRLAVVGRLAAAIGVVHQPGTRVPQPWPLDLDAHGHLLVLGAVGSGRTTVLRTAAAAFAARLSPEDLHVYALDCDGGGLAGLAVLPHCGGVVEAGETERTERLFAMLDDLIEERTEALVAAGAGSFVEYRAGGEPVPYVLLLLDDYPAFHNRHVDTDRGDLVERLATIATAGSGVGVHLMLTAERLDRVPPALCGVMRARLALDPERAGRGLVNSTVDLQVAYVGADPSGAGQRKGLTELGHWRRVEHGGRPSVPPVEVLPDLVVRADLSWNTTGGHPLLGISGIDHGPSRVNFTERPTFLVFGPERSGRSAALTTLALGLREQSPQWESYLLAPRPSALRELAGWVEVASTVDECDEMAVELATLARNRARWGGEPFLVVVDDADDLLAGRGSLALEAVVRHGRETGLRLLAAVRTETAHRVDGGWLADARQARHGLILAPDAEVDGALFGLRLPRMTGRRFPVGRGYVVRCGEVELVQVAIAG